MAASLIDRLPTGKRSRYLQLLSRNANGAGAATRQTNGRNRRDWDSRVCSLGIVLIESNVTGALAANIGTTLGAGYTTVTLAEAGMTPATTDITANEMDAVTWAAGGTKTVTATSTPTGAKGEALVTV